MALKMQDKKRWLYVAVPVEGFSFSCWGHSCKEGSTFSLMYMQATVPDGLQAEKYVFGWPVFTFKATHLKAQNFLKLIWK